MKMVPIFSCFAKISTPSNKFSSIFFHNSKLNQRATYDLKEELKYMNF
jgi:hypothetical protein